MARTRTLAQLRDDVRWQADKEGFQQRHTDARLNRAINQAIQEYREHVSANGSPYFLAATAPATMAAGAAAGVAFGSITLGSNLGRVYGIDVTVDGHIRPLRSIEFDSRNDFQGSTAPPEYFFLYNQTTVGILPAPDAQYSYTIWYLPPHTDLVNDGDSFDGQYGWEEYVVFNAATKLHIRDDEPERLQAVFAERERLLGDIKRQSTRQRQGPQKRQDARSRHALERDRRTWGGGGGGAATSWPISIVPVSLGNGTTRADLVIQQCIDAASAAGGGEVWLLPGAAGYRLEGTITLKKYVTLRGFSDAVGRGRKVLDINDNGGSMLLVAHTGKAIVMNQNSCVDGVEIYYTDQVLTGTPVAHDWTFFAETNHGICVRNINAYNPYQLASLAVDGAVFENVYAWPLFSGIRLNSTGGGGGDVVRLCNIHFNPNMLPQADASLRAWVNSNCNNMQFTGVDNFQVVNYHCFGGLRGMHFFDGGVTPGSTGSVANFGFDQVGSGIVVEDQGVSNDGIKFVNGVIIPTFEGVKISDTTQGGTYFDRPRVNLSQVSFFHGATYARGVWVEASSYARVVMSACELHDFTDEGVLNQSANSVGRLIACEMPPAVIRINNPGAGDWTETASL